MNKLLSDEVNQELIYPGHIGIIMDGNGRWAKQAGMNRVYGHSNAVDSVKSAITYCAEHPVDILTLYAFSTENWKRPRHEIDHLMSLILKFIKKEGQKVIEEGVRLVWLGRKDRVPSEVADSLGALVEQSAGNTRLTLNLALDYGSREEILSACKTLMSKCLSGELTPEDVTEDDLQSALYTHGQHDVDLLIRTSGELRISNFMLWQIAYAELYFLPVFWPDFREEHMTEAVEAYRKRVRRLGGIH